tara:strand:+ start:574 stop:1191 length:618 start_codon:yes stop_codon:yes gene_type:complete
MAIRNRIKNFEKIRAGDLIPNPKNWREHSAAQRDGLQAMLDKVGYADAVIVRETPEGYMLIDGHLRADTNPDSEIPVLITDLSETEADEVLATLDPIAMMASTNQDKLDQLLDSISAGRNSALAELLENVSRVVPEPVAPPAAFSLPAVTQEQLDQRDLELQNMFAERGGAAQAASHLDVVCPDCGTEFSIAKDEFSKPDYGRDS